MIRNSNHLEVGRVGEDIAKDYLTKNGYKILDSNYKTKYAEIDIIAKKKNQLIFVEVRTKTNEDFGTPEDTIDNRKKRKLLNNARGYAARTKYTGPYRIDAICIILAQDNNGEYQTKRFNHYENIIN